jgi:hypothetical protein
MVLGTFTWMAPLSDEERAAVTFSPAREELADGDLYLDATSPKRGPTLAFDGEWVPAGGAYILRSKVDDALWERLVAAAAGTIR